MYLRCLLLLTAFVVADASKVRYDGKVVLSVVPSEEAHFQFLSYLEDHSQIDIWNELARNTTVHVMIDRNNQTTLMPIFETLNMKPKVMINDIQRLLDGEEQTLRTLSRMGSGRGIQDSFYTYDELTNWLKQMEADFPNFATLVSIGKTYENRDIWLLKITSPSGGAKKTAMMDFGIHAREWISPATGAYLINEFLTQYSAGGDAKTIMDTWELHIVPVLNPDGYAYSHSRDRMWRKNRKPVSGTCVGVDLNRNFGHQWNTGGSSASACADTFHGGSRMSENEAKALEKYMTGKSWTTYLTFHSYGQWWFTVKLVSWGYTTVDPPNYALLKQKAQIGANAIQSVNGRRYTLGSSAQLLYIASGGSEDWTAGSLGIFYSYCLELPPTGGTGFIAPTSEIKRTGAETFVGMVAYFKAI
ncbi:unnamed protein product [Rotaria magnacalcarata]|uniref:Peptidase M14 domain-containing protein n=2 Tax=Rotaria magnacalcarata TaxID=392030 RepID=A0A814ZV44_9BILA|nr:unnamed protein product [Rotaria magnacalcarata]